MQASRKNELWIGFTLSVLLSLFVNFSLWMCTYEQGAYRPSIKESLSPEDYFLYFSLFWFFAFAFFLFLLNSRLYRASERWFPGKEYKRTICTVLVSTAGAFGLFFLYPKVHELVRAGWQQEGREQKSYRSTTSREASSSPVNAFSFSFDPTRPLPPADRNGTKDQPWRPEAGFPFIPDAGWPLPFPRPLVTEHLFVLLTVILSVGLMRLLSSKQQMQLQYEQLKTEKLQSSYNAFMGQINPHFFFNSLNGLSSLIRSGEQERTVRYLDELSQVFRYILQSNKKELVTLAEELQFVKAYTYLLSVRYEGKLFFSIQATPDHLLWYLPILSILPLIENAVKHNVISKQYPLQFDIYTTQENELQVSNKIQPKAEESAGNGIGLRNLWGRYRTIRTRGRRAEGRTNAITGKDRPDSSEAYPDTAFSPHAPGYTLQSLLVMLVDKFYPLPVEDIFYFYTAHEKVTAYTSDGKQHPIDRTLDALNEQLDERLFFRANRQFIISRKAIRDVDLWFGSRLSVNLHLPIPEKIIISKTKTPVFKKWILAEEI